MAQRDAAEQEEVQVKDDQHAGARHEKRRQPEAERLEAAAGSSSDSSSKAEADEVLYETEQNTSPQSQEGGQAAKQARRASGKAVQGCAQRLVQDGRGVGGC